MGQIDHLILGISNLKRGIERFEQMTGVMPIYGGEHPGVGTHNGLAALGAGAYMELIAPRPGAKLGARWSELAELDDLSPVGWAVGVDDLESSRDRLRQAGIETTSPASGSRAQPDGSTLRWKVSGIAEPAIEMAPFLIEWSPSSAHPSTTAPTGCAIESLEIEVPESSALAQLVETLGLEAAVATGRESRMAFVLTCPKGGKRVSFNSRA